MQLLQARRVTSISAKKCCFSGIVPSETAKDEYENIFVYRCEHLHAFCEVADEGHDGHFLHEPLDLAELHHEAVFIRQALKRLALLLKLSQDFDLILCRLEAHQALNKVHLQGP